MYIDNLDVLEVCDWTDVQELIDSEHHEGIVIARERYERFRVPRPLAKKLCERCTRKPWVIKSMGPRA